MEERTRKRNEAAVVVSLVVLATVLPFATSVGILAGGGMVTILLTAIALRRRMVAASSTGVLFVAVLLLGLIGLGPQQLLFGVAFVAYWVVTSRLAWLREAASWRSAGSYGPLQAAAGVALGLVSGLALRVWYEGRQAELADLVAMVPDWPLAALVIAGVIFAVVNAVLEEAVYRGVLQDSLERVLGSGFATLTLQAVAFATLHFLTGIPSGAAGIALAFVYGLLLGVLRRRSGGMAVPVIAHAITDLAIVGIVLARVAA